MDSAAPESDYSPGSRPFVRESQSMSLAAFASYYGHRLPQCALIDEMGVGEDGHSESNEALRQGESLSG